jgi:hypothetical protein
LNVKAAIFLLLHENSDAEEEEDNLMNDLGNRCSQGCRSNANGVLPRALQILPISMGLEVRSPYIRSHLDLCQVTSPSTHISPHSTLEDLCSNLKKKKKIQRIFEEKLLNP